MLIRGFVFLLSLMTIKCFAGQDTTYTYFDIKRNITQPTNAIYVSKTAKEYNSWHKQVFVLSNGSLYMDGYYSDEKTKVPNGIVKYIGENKRTTDSCFFINGQLKAKYNFYKSGVVKSYVLFADSNRVTGQGGYNENGKAINNYVVWRPAMYPKNIEGWQKYLKKKFKQNQPGGYRKGMMSGKVIIQFTINTTDNMKDAKIIQTSRFIDLDQRALTVIQDSPNWIPAVKDNQLIESVKQQPVIFVNSEASIFNVDSFDLGYEAGYLIGSFLRY